MAGARLRLVPHGPPALDALTDLVDGAKQGDPLAPVTVVPPSTVAGLSIRRTLGARRGLVNTRFMPLARVAELLGAPVLAASGLLPLTEPVRRSAIRAVLAGEPGLFEAVADSAATEDALDLAFTELRALDDEALDAFAGRGARQREVARLFRAFRERTAGRYDDLALARAAAGAVAGQAPTLADVGTVVLHLPRSLPAGRRELPAALAAADRLSAVVGLTGDASADAPVRDLAADLEAWLGPAEPAGAGPDEGDVQQRPRPRHVVVAPDPEEEVRWAVRELLAADPASAPNLAIVSADVEPYGRIAADVLAEAGVPHHGPATPTLAQSVAGRLVLGALALPGKAFARHDVTAWLSSAPVLGDDHGPVAVERWDRVSREAGVTAGLDRWVRGLTAYEQRLAHPRPDETEPDAERREQRRRDAVDLLAFVRELESRLRPPTPPTWRAMAGWAATLLHRYGGGEAHISAWPDHEIEARREVEHAVEALGELDAVEPAPTTAVFRRALDQSLAAPAPRTTTFGDGVFVGRVGDVVGAVFDRVHVVGMVEGEFPRPAAGSSLVSEADRQALDGLLDGAERRRDEHHALLAAFAAAPERSVSMPRSDPRSGRPRHPSPWLLDVASELHGEALFGETLLEAGGAWLVALPSAEAGLLRGAVPLSLAERDARELAARRAAGRELPGSALRDDDPDLARALDAVAARASGRATPWDGLVGAGLAALTERTHSPTSLEQWATCPFRYFLAHVLRVSPQETPEEIEVLSGIDRGSLVHDVLERFVAERGISKPPGDPWSDDDHRHLDEIVDDVFDEYETRGRTGRPLLWELRQTSVRRELHRTLAEDDALREARGCSPAAVEMGFGLGDDPPVEVELRDGRRLRFRGRVDRVDVAPAGDRLRVVDYKTGRPLESKTKDPYEGDHFRDGTQLQLPVYALAARREYGDVPTRAEYWYVTERGGFKVEGYDVDQPVLDEYVDLVTRVAGGIEAGVFPARPGDDAYDFVRGRDTYEHCRYCDFDRVCPADRAEAWDRKRHDGAFETYVELAEGPRDEVGGGRSDA